MDNYRDWFVWNFVWSIFDYYMISYDEETWVYPLERMGACWMDGKMCLPAKKDMIRSVPFKDNTEHAMTHTTFYYMLVSGIQSPVNAMTEGTGAYTDCPVEKLNMLPINGVSMVRMHMIRLSTHAYRSNRVSYQSTLTFNVGNKPGESCADPKVIVDYFNLEGLDKDGNELPEELG